jgi:hypothetical protein
MQASTLISMLQLINAPLSQDASQPPPLIGRHSQVGSASHTGRVLAPPQAFLISIPMLANKHINSLDPNTQPITSLVRPAVSQLRPASAAPVPRQ